MTEAVLTTGSVPKNLLKFAVPFMLASLLQILYGATDLFVVGHFAETADVSAVSVGSQIMNLITYTTIGLTAGITVTLGQHIGEKSETDIRKTAGSGILLFLGVAVLAVAVLLVFRRQFVALMNTPAQAVDKTLAYVRICTFGTPFIIGYNVTGSFFRAAGNSRTPLLFVGIAAVMNVAADFILVYYFHMGARGTAIATVCAQFSSFAAAVVYIRVRSAGFPLSLSDIRVSPAHAARILKVGAPLALQEALVTVSFLVITLIINRMGLVASAAVGVVEKLISFLMMPTAAFSTAVSAMTAQNFGAGQMDRAYRALRSGILMALCPAAVVCAFCWIRGEVLTSLFTQQPEVIDAAAQYLRTYSIDCVTVAFVFNLNGFLNGCGRTTFTMAHSLITTFAVRIPVTVWCSRLAGASLLTMGIAAPASSAASVLLCLLYLLRNRDRLGPEAALPGA